MSGERPSLPRGAVDVGLDRLIFVVLASMTVIVALNVFCRFALRFSLSWADETAMILMVWLTFLGAAVAMRDRMHYAFDYVVERLPGNAPRQVRLFGYAASILMTLLLVYWSARVVFLITDWVMPATGIKRAWVYAACPVGGVFLLYYQIRLCLAEWRDGGARRSTEKPKEA